MNDEEKREQEKIQDEEAAVPAAEEQIVPGDNGEGDGSPELLKVAHLSGMYRDWFLDYASYVIMERAVPNVVDGLKPVQRRILHAMKQLDDGRYNKVANIIGHTMQYHPHGDASIGDALVQLGQKGLLIDTQGNWGNILTGDSAAAPRYIEARLSKFALEVVFNNKTTEWKLSYDGRNKEPVTLPVKFPLLLAFGGEGIAVGLASKILPHNFNELCDASISYLRGQDFELLPDFPTGGLADFTRYNDGLRGGQIRVRARISKRDKKTLVITEIPYGKTTGTLIDSIVKANDKGKIKVKKIDDNTAGSVEIVIHLAPGVSPDKTIDALYAFTDCEVPISPNACVIDGDKPNFMGVKEILRRSAAQTKHLLGRELEIRKGELEEAWHLSSLEKIFIENRIYRDIEECETWEAVVKAIDKGLSPFKKLFYREITRDDIVHLTEIKIKRISKYDVKKAEEAIRAIEEELEEVKNHLANLNDYTINYYKQIKKKYGKDYPRRTEIRNFETIVATKVAVANARLYVNRKEGFVGTSLKKDEFVTECSDIDDMIVFLRNGKYIVTRVTDKAFIGKDILHVGIFKKNDSRTVYNVIYRDGREPRYLVKRFAVTGVTRDKEYDVTRGKPGSRIFYFSANPNGEAEVVRVHLRPRPRMKKTAFDFDFGTQTIKGRNSMGNLLTKNAVLNITMKEKGVSTLGGRKIWFDDTVLRLNADGRGMFLGEFSGEDRILVVRKNGTFRITNFDLENHYEDDILLINKFDDKKVWSAVYFDAGQGYYYVKRFSFESSEKLQSFIGDNPESKLVSLTEVEYPRLEVSFGGRNKGRAPEIIEVAEFIGVKSFRARGKRLTNYQVDNIRELEPVVKKEDEQEDDLLVVDESQPVEPVPEEEKKKKGPHKPDDTPPPDDGAQMTLDLG